MNKLAPLSLALLAAGCTSTTVVSSSPDRAQVILDGAPRGETPYTLSEQVNAGTRHQLTLKKAGYKDLNTFIAADQWNVGKVIISAIFCLPCLFFSSEYPPGYNFTLQPDQQGYPPPAGYPPPQSYPPPAYPPPSYPPPAQGYPPPPPPPSS